jgi:CubicO group peptidase (beta-lactamase class C family)
MLRSAFALALIVAPLSAQQPSRAAIVQRIDSLVSAPMKTGNLAGMAIAVVKGRDTLLMKGYGYADLENQVPVTPQTVFRIGSLTKQFTSAAIMKFVEQGKLSLDDDITKYLPQVPTHGRKILIRHLLNHTSGIPSYTDVREFGPKSRTDLAHDSLLAIVAKDSLQFEPGSHFYYNNTGYFILGMLIEKLSGKPYGEYLSETEFTPNGLASTTYCDTRRIITHRAQGYQRGRGGLENADFLSMDLPYAAGSLCSTVGDLVSWSRKLHSGAIVSPASLRRMTTPEKLTSGRTMPYGYGLQPDTLGGHRYVAHGGGINGFISYLVHFPDDTLTVAVLSNTGPAPSDRVAMDAARVVFGLPIGQPVPPPKDLALTPQDRARYAGSYDMTFPDGTRRLIGIVAEDERLVLVDGQARLRMQSQGDHEFFVPGQGRVKFDVANDKATGFVLNGSSSRPLEAVRRP